MPRIAVEPGTATPIATGGMLPRGADAVAMVEITTSRPDGTILVRKPVAPGQGVAFAGTDMARGELVLRRGTRLTSREIGVLAALGFERSRGDPPAAGRDPLDGRRDRRARASPCPLGSVYDSNAAILAAAVREAGRRAGPRSGIVGDDERELSEALDRALATADLVVLCGGTSKGAGDLSYRVLSGRSPGIVVHGVALKPGKPVCLGAVGATPGRHPAGLPDVGRLHVPRVRRPPDPRAGGPPRGGPRGRSPRRSRPGSTAIGAGSEYLLVHLVPGDDGLSAYPMGKGSGSVTAFCRPTASSRSRRTRNSSTRASASRVDAARVGPSPRRPDRHRLALHRARPAARRARRRRGSRRRRSGSARRAGSRPRSRGECDLAGIHLLDAATGHLQRPVPARGRAAPSRIRPDAGDRLAAGRSTGSRDREALVTRSLDDPRCAMVNRNRGSGTRRPDRRLARREAAAGAFASRPARTTRSARRSRRDGPIGAWPSRRWRASMGLASSPLREERYDFAVPAIALGPPRRSRRSGRCWPTAPSDPGWPTPDSCRSSAMTEAP